MSMVGYFTLGQIFKWTAHPIILHELREEKKLR